MNINEGILFFALFFFAGYGIGCFLGQIFIAIFGV